MKFKTIQSRLVVKADFLLLNVCIKEHVFVKSNDFQKVFLQEEEDMETNEGDSVPSPTVSLMM